MPSLPAARKELRFSPLDSFHNYLPNPNAVNNPIKPKGKSQLILFCKFMIEFTVLSTILTVPTFVLQYYHFNDNQNYSKYNLTYIKNFVRACYWCLFVQYWIRIQFGNYIYYIADIECTNTNIFNKKRYFSTTNIIVSLINCMFIYFMIIRYDVFSTIDIPSIKLGFLCGNIIHCDEGSSISFYYVYKHAIALPFILTLIAIINHITFIIFSCFHESGEMEPDNNQEIISYSYKFGYDRPRRTSKSVHKKRYFGKNNELSVGLQDGNETSIFTDDDEAMENMNDLDNLDNQPGVSASNLSFLSPSANTVTDTENTTSNFNSNIKLYDPLFDQIYEKSSWDITKKFLISSLCLFIIVFLTKIVMYMVVTFKTSPNSKENSRNYLILYYSFYVSIKLILQPIAIFLGRIIDILRMQIPKTLCDNHNDIYRENTLVSKPSLMVLKDLDQAEHENINENENANDNVNLNALHAMAKKIGYKQKKEAKRLEDLSHLSFEVTVLIFISLCYWFVYRMLIIHKVPMWSDFVQSKAFRFASLVWTVCARASWTKYWIVTHKWMQSLIDCFKNERNCQCIRKMGNLLGNILHVRNDDDETIEHKRKIWTQRLSIDLIIEFINSINTCLITCLILNNSKKTFVKYDHAWSVDTYQTAMNYNIISGGLELIYFAMIFVWYHQVLKISFLELFLRFYHWNRYAIVIWFSVCLGIIINFVPNSVLAPY